MIRCFYLSIGLLAALMSRRTFAASSWDMDSSRMPRSVSQGSIETGQNGKDSNLVQRVLPAKLDSQTDYQQEGIGTSPAHALTSVVSSQSGLVAESVQTKTIAVVADTQTFKVCVSGKKPNSAEAAVVEADATTTPIGMGFSESKSPKQSDTHRTSKPEVISLNDALKRFLGERDLKILKTSDLENRSAGFTMTFGSQVLTR